jgi:hypothetical protein
MTFSISDMSSAINSYNGVMRPNRFSVMITPPPWNSDSNECRLIEVFCDQASLPGITFATNDVKNLGYGPTFKLPHTPIYTDVDATVLLDNDAVVLGFFQKWVQNVMNVNPAGSPSTSGYNGARMYAVQYPSNYVTTVSIMLYDGEANTIVQYSLNEAYPLRLGQPTLDWSNNNQVLKLPVTFTFRTWTSTLFAANDQSLEESMATFDPFATTVSGSLYDTSTYSYLSLGQALTNAAVSLINNSGTYSNNLVNIFN